MALVYLGNTFDHIKDYYCLPLENFIFEAKIDGYNYKYKMFLTSGRERYRSIAMNTIDYSDGFLLIFSVTDRGSFDNLGEWIKSIERRCDIKKKVLILVGNKIDEENRVVTKEEAIKFSRDKNIDYYEVSAKTGIGIKEVFQKFCEEVYKKCKDIKYNLKIINDKSSKCINDKSFKNNLNKFFCF